MGRGRLRAIGMAAALAAVGVHASAALAEPVKVTTAVVPEVPQGPRGPIEYRAALTTGAEAKHLNVEIEAPFWSVSDRRGPFGRPLAERAITLEGPGRITGSRTVDADYAPGTCVRGGDTRTRAVKLELPPNTTSTLSLAYRLAGPFSGADLELGLGLVDLDEGVATIAAFAPRLGGRLGVPIQLRSRSPRRLARGRALRVSGRTDARLAGRRIVMSLHPSDAPAGRRPTASRRVPVDEAGRFAWRVRPRRAGAYRIEARYPGDSRFTPDEACPLGFSVAQR